MDGADAGGAEFRSVAYWDEFFSRRGVHRAFEWYGEWSDFARLVSDVLPSTTGPCCVVGCGNSDVSAAMYDAGLVDVTSIDFSRAVIDEMARKSVSRPGLKWRVMDMTALEFDADAFDAVIDKGALDALMSAAGDAADSEGDARRMLSGIERVLRPCGVYVCVTLAQAQIVRCLWRHFVEPGGWWVEFRPFVPSEAPGDTPRCPYVCVVRRGDGDDDGCGARVAPFGGPGTASPVVESVAHLFRALGEAQTVYLALVRLDVVRPGMYRKLDLWAKDDAGGPDGPRFSVTVVDASDKQTCGVLLVPQGREGEWLFASREGQLQVTSGAGLGRLVFVTMNRGHTFSDAASVQEELTHSLLPLLPRDCHGRTPFLGVADDIGHRVVLAHVRSDVSGDMFIEDVDVAATGTTRRLVFASNKNAVQSEARMVAPLPRRRKGKRLADRGADVPEGGVELDVSYLALEYHRAIVVGLGFVVQVFMQRAAAGDRVKVLVVGLGGGALPGFLAHHFRFMDVETVELDSAVIDIAQRWFGLRTSPSCRVTVGDGVAVLNEYASVAPATVDVVVVDVDSKDLSTGMSFPPAAFLRDAFLDTVCSAMRPTGLLVLNMACRAASLADDTLQALRRRFAEVHVLPSAGDVNRVVFALPNRGLWGSSHAAFEAAVRNLSELATPLWGDKLNALKWAKGVELDGRVLASSGGAGGGRRRKRGKGR